MRTLRMFPLNAGWGDIDNLFNQLSRDFFNNKSTFSQVVSKASYPKVDVKNTPVKVIIEATVPGLTKDDINVDYKDEVLTISALNRNEDCCDNEDCCSEYDEYVYKEIHKSTFKRSFTLPKDEFIVEDIDGKCENGILTLVIPKKNAKDIPSKKIEIK